MSFTYIDEFKKRKADLNLVKFTMIELLCVVAVLMLLASMLFPALQKAKNAGRQIECANHLQQIGKAYNMYADDYNGYFCVFWTWPTLLSPYLNQNWTGKYYVGPPQPGSKMDMFFCPSNCDSKANMTGSYVLNEIILGNYYSSACKFRIYQIKKPSNELILTEASTDSGTGYFNVSIWNSTQIVQGVNCKIEWVHSKHANVLFVDGHVKSHAQNTITWDMFCN